MTFVVQGVRDHTRDSDNGSSKGGQRRVHSRQRASQVIVDRVEVFAEPVQHTTYAAMHESIDQVSYLEHSPSGVTSCQRIVALTTPSNSRLKTTLDVLNASMDCTVVDTMMTIAVAGPIAPQMRRRTADPRWDWED